MKVHATLNNLRIAPRKVRLVTRALVGVDTTEALVQLQKMVKQSAGPLYTLLRSAVANATNNHGLDEKNLYIHTIFVGDGLRLERWLPRAFGRATPLIRRGANITLTLEEKIEGKNRVVKKLPMKVSTAPVSEEKTEEEKDAETKEEKGVAHRFQPEMKKEGGKGEKPAVGKVVKKMFQRKSS